MSFVSASHPECAQLPRLIIALLLGWSRRSSPHAPLLTRPDRLTTAVLEIDLIQLAPGSITPLRPQQQRSGAWLYPPPVAPVHEDKTTTSRGFFRAPPNSMHIPAPRPSHSPPRSAQGARPAAARPPPSGSSLRVPRAARPGSRRWTWGWRSRRDSSRGARACC